MRPIAFAREYIRAEQPWMDALARGNLPISILRPPWIIGPGSWFAEIYLTHIRTHHAVPLFGEGKNFMSLLDVEDCAGLIAHAVRHSPPGRCQNLFVPGACVTQLEFAERLSQLTGTRLRRLSRAEIKRNYGETMLEAVTFSNQAATRYPEFISSYRFRHPTLDAMLRHNLPVAPAVGTEAQSLARNE